MSINKKIDPKQYKGILLEYKCQACNIVDSIQEDFQSKISKIKSDNCSHFSFTFIFDLDKKGFKYLLSFNCNNCGTNHIIDIFKENLDFENDIQKINYKCKKCGKGSLDINLFLEKKDDNNNKKNNTKNYNTNNIKEYRTDGEDNSEVNSNFKQEMKQDVLGGAANINNQKPLFNEVNKLKCININYISINNKNNLNNRITNNNANNNGFNMNNNIANNNINNNNFNMNIANNNGFNMNNNIANNNINNNNMNKNMANNNRNINNFNMNNNIAYNNINNNNYRVNNNTFNNNLNVINKMSNINQNGYNYNNNPNFNNNFNNFNYNNNNIKLLYNWK